MYELADAMFGLPLVCKGCGQHLKVPPPGTDEMGSPVAAAPPPPADVSAPPSDAAAPPPPVADVPDSPAILSPEAWAKLDAPQLAAAEPKPWGAVSAPLPPEAAPPRDRKALAIVVDGLVVLVLFVLGAFLGEFIVRKSSAEVLEGLSAPKFPPTDLLLWLAAPAFLILVYMLLALRGRSLGCRLRKR